MIKQKLLLNWTIKMIGNQNDPQFRHQSSLTFSRLYFNLWISQNGSGILNVLYYKFEIISQHKDPNKPFSTLQLESSLRCILLILVAFLSRKIRDDYNKMDALLSIASRLARNGLRKRIPIITSELSASVLENVLLKLVSLGGHTNGLQLVDVPGCPIETISKLIFKNPLKWITTI